MNGDLGTDAGTVALNLMAKAGEALLEAIRALIKGMYQMYMDSPQRKLDLINLKEAKTREEKIDILKNMQGVDGYIKTKQLEKYCNAINARIIPRNMEFEKECQMGTFFKVAKEQHLLYSMTNDKNDPLKVTIFVADCDMELLNRCKELTDDTLRLEKIDEKIESVMGGRPINELTDAERLKVDLLNAEKANINNKWTNVFNTNAYDNILSSVLLSSHGEKTFEADKIKFNYKVFNNDTYQKNHAFASALDSDTRKTLSKDRFSVVASTVDPNKYIICHSENNPDKLSKKKIITSYEVFNGKQTEDGKNISKVYSDASLSAKEWIDMRNEMQDFGGFGEEDLMRFDSVAEFENWRLFAREQNSVEEIRVYNDNELQNAIQKRTEELHEKGFEIRDDGEVYNIEDGRKAKDVIVELKKAIESKSGVMKNANEPTSIKVYGEKAKMSEAVYIGLEITNYNALSKVNNDLATLKTNLAIAEINKDEEKISSIKSEIDGLTQKHDALSKEREAIVEKRKEVNSVQADLDRRKLAYEYRFTKEEIKDLQKLGKDFETVGLGNAKDFTDKIQNMDFKKACVYLAHLSVEVGNACTEEKNHGEDITDLANFRTDLTKFQNEMLEKVKTVEPDVFYKTANLELSGNSLVEVEKLADEYEKMGLGTKEEFVDNIKSAYGNERLDVIDSYKRQMVNHILSEKDNSNENIGVADLGKIENNEFISNQEDCLAWKHEVATVDILGKEMTVGVKSYLFEKNNDFYLVSDNLNGNINCDKVDYEKAQRFMEKHEVVVTEKGKNFDFSPYDLMKESELTRRFDRLSSNEFNKIEKANKEFVANIGELDNDKESNKEQTIDGWEKDIKDKKETEPINGNKEKEKGHTKETQSKNDR